MFAGGSSACLICEITEVGNKTHNNKEYITIVKSGGDVPSECKAYSTRREVFVLGLAW